MLDFSAIKQLTVDGIDLKSLAINGVQVWKSGLLPAGYQQVESIASTGSQYVVIPIGPTVSYVANLDIAFAKTGSRSLMGHGPAAGYYFGATAAGLFELGGGVETKGVSAYPRQTITVENTSSYMTLKAEGYNQIKRSKGNGTSHTLRLLGGLSGVSCSAELYGCVITSSDGTELYNLIPCYRTSDGKAGLYNLTNNEFLGSSGNAPLILGPEIN